MSIPTLPRHVPDLSRLRHKPSDEETAEGRTITITYLADGEVAIGVPPALTLGEIGAAILMLQRLGIGATRPEQAT